LRAEGPERRCRSSSGAYTDTFPPLLYTQLDTLPGSALPFIDRPPYPDKFEVSTYRSVAQRRTVSFLEVGLGQAVVIGLLAAAVGRLRRTAARP